MYGVVCPLNPKGEVLVFLMIEDVADWSKDRSVTAEGLIAAMDKAGVDKAAIVQASPCYGYDYAYMCDSIARFPHRLTGVGSVDVLQPDAPKTIRHWVERGTNGFRLFTGGSTAAFDPSTLDDPRSFPTWQLRMDVRQDGSGSVSRMVDAVQLSPAFRISSQTIT